MSFKDNAAKKGNYLDPSKIANILRPVKNVLGARTFNTMGYKYFGYLQVDQSTYLQIWAICFLYLPIIPIQIYLMRDTDRGILCLGRVPTVAFMRTFGIKAYCTLFISAWMEGVAFAAFFLILLFILINIVIFFRS